jgi:hypothetical protein
MKNRERDRKIIFFLEKDIPLKTLISFLFSDNYSIRVFFEE